MCRGRISSHGAFSLAVTPAIFLHHVFGSVHTAKLSHCLQRDVSELWLMLANMFKRYAAPPAYEARVLFVLNPACQISSLAFDVSSTDPECSGGQSSSPQQMRTRLCTQPKAQLGLFHWVVENKCVNAAPAHGCVRPSSTIRLHRFRLGLSH